MPSIAGAHHMALTVRDVERSAAVLRAPRMQELMSGDDDTVKFRGSCIPFGRVLGVWEYAEGSGDSFDELRTGLDHFESLRPAVPTSTITESWTPGAWRTPGRDTPIGSVVCFCDPDNIQLEFWYSSF